jgi:hypothetical protein
MLWAKAAARAMDSGAARDRIGVGEMACWEGWPVNWGGPPEPAASPIAAEAWPGIRQPPKSESVRRESERGIVPMIAGTT